MIHEYSLKAINIVKQQILKKEQCLRKITPMNLRVDCMHLFKDRYSNSNRYM